SADLRARALLAQYYRADGYAEEAGRWGYFNEATPAERAAYEHQCAHRRHEHWTATYILRGLRWTAPLESVPQEVCTILTDLRNRSERETTTWWDKVHPVRSLLARALSRLTRTPAAAREASG
ncbi:MAG: hypothetical protein AVDCRST_MAG93-1294, partial [uncultured Chloroflexia bacterium]